MCDLLERQPGPRLTCQGWVTDCHLSPLQTILQRAVGQIGIRLDHHKVLLLLLLRLTLKVLLLLALGLTQFFLILGSILLATRLEQFRMGLVASHGYLYLSVCELDLEYFLACCNLFKISLYFLIIRKGF